MLKPSCFFVVLIAVIGLLACGDDSGTNPTNVSTLSTFSSIRTNVFTPVCAVSGCHNGSERPNLSASVAYANIVNVPSTQGLDYIEPGNPDNSYLYRKLAGVNIVGDRMPRGRAPLPQAAIDSIRVWIQKGALNN
jgi:hypothetical protein